MSARDLEELYAERRRATDAVSAHMPVLRELASQCRTCVEFGVRRANSTVALLAGCPGRVHSYDIEVLREHEPHHDAIRAVAGDRWHMHVEDSRTADVPECDLLMHDSLHNYEHVRAELAHAPKVRKFLVFHDSVSHGDQGQSVGRGKKLGKRDKGVLGIRLAIDELMIADRTWFLRAHYPNDSGLLVLERIPPRE